MDKWNEQMFETIKRCGDASKFKRESKGASMSVISGEEMVSIPLKEYKLDRDLLINKTMRKSKAASVSGRLNDDVIFCSFLSQPKVKKSHIRSQIVLVLVLGILCSVNL
ncbi:MAG: hypothetical protein M3O24_02990 [Thermoproteota archaeon]|nr:hypothetical protein [Thermoproteota archaeon]